MRNFSPEARAAIQRRVDAMVDLGREHRQKLLDIWGLSDKPTTRERRLQLEAMCWYFRENPDLICLVPPSFVFEVMRAFVEEAKIKRYSAPDVAAHVDMRIDAGVDKTEARKTVAEMTGRTFEAVKAAHYRLGRHAKA